MDLLDRIGLEHPVVQAGMGGGVAGGELAAAVSAAGGLGTVGLMAPVDYAAALAQARRLAPGRPVAANLIVPFAKPAHVGACAEAGAALVVLHGGLGAHLIRALRNAGIPVFCTVGDVAQARRALAAGADGLVAQGLEAGGHLMGSRPLADLLPQVLDVAGAAPVLAAGGVVDAADVRRLTAAGAVAAVAGTRFLLTDESRAHPEYKRRVVAADRTLHTMLFGVGWPLAHRVVPNAATDRWCRRSEFGPRGLGLLQRTAGPIGRVVPMSALDKLTARQRPALPLFGPGLPTRDMSADSVDRCALYAGETAHRLDDVIPAAEAVARLVP